MSAILLLLELLNSSRGDNLDSGICVARLVALDEVLLLRVSAQHLSLCHLVLRLYVVGSLLGIH